MPSCDGSNCGVGRRSDVIVIRDNVKENELREKISKLENELKKVRKSSFVDFNRLNYLEKENYFETASVTDPAAELAEFKSDSNRIALELAYTRYRLAKTEEDVQNLKNILRSSSSACQVTSDTSTLDIKRITQSHFNKL
jgi:translation initiation factor 2B subunit (eIF-2B alpha/beta/delta family)